MSIRHFLGNIHRAALSASNRREYRLPWDGPVVSFTFDDFPQSAARIGSAILKDYGARGTFYAAMGLMGGVNNMGRQFADTDLETLLCEGHELGSHTFGHLSCRSVSLRSFEADALKGKQAVERYTGSNLPHHFSFPQGHITLRAKRALGYVAATCRGIEPGVNKSPVDLNLLRANSIYSGNFDMDSIGRLMRENERHQGWLIFYTHDLSENPSPFGCRPGEFESVVRFAERTGARMMTVGQTASAVSAPPGRCFPCGF